MARKSAQAVAEAVATLVEAVAEAAPVEGVEEPALTVAEVEVEAAPVEAAPVVTVLKPAIGAIGKMVEELLSDASLGYFQIVEKVVAAFPNARTSRRSIASVAADMRKRGLEVPMRNGKQMA